MVRRCLSSVSSSNVGEGEYTKHAFHANYNAFLWQTNRLFCMHLSNNPPIYLNQLAERMPSGLSSKRCGMLTSRTELKHYSFNLFISCHSTFCNSKRSVDSQFWFENRQYPLRLLAQEMFNFNDNRDRLAQRHFETSEILLNLQKNPNESHKLN